MSFGMESLHFNKALLFCFLFKSSLCHLLSFSGLGDHDTDINNFISTLGFTSADYCSKLLENVSTCYAGPSTGQGWKVCWC